MFAVAVNAHWNLHVHLSYQNVFSREIATKISLYRLNSDRKNKIEREKSLKKRIREQNKIYNFILTRVLSLSITTTRTILHSIFQNAKWQAHLRILALGLLLYSCLYFIIECSQSYGENCRYPCSSHCYNQSCDKFNGRCLYCCTDGFYGELCDKGK